MCGILVAFNPSGIDSELVSKFTYSLETLNHRGPDNKGFYEDDSVLLGHTRLSIIDVDQSSNQPFREKEYILTYNGEIFNFEEIRKELIILGYSFRTNSDTEVFIKSYLEWGSKCFQKFNGMWSAVIYNSKDKSILVSRDRFGQKPLFYAFKDGTFYFSSETRQISLLLNCEPNYCSILSFLKEGDFNTDGQTFFEEIQEFPSASFLLVNSDLEIKQDKFWNYPLKGDKRTTNKTFLDFESLLIDAVKIRLRSDVPVSVCLSGGVDSTIITDIIREELVKTDPISTYTYSSNDINDESEYAIKIANQLRCQNIIVERISNPESFVNHLKPLVISMGRGHSSPAIIPYSLIQAQMRKDGFRVSIDGQGADELLAGYPLTHIALIFENILKLKFIKFYKSLLGLIKSSKDFKFGIIFLFIHYVRAKSSPMIRKLMRLIYGYELFFSDCSTVKKTKFTLYKSEISPSGGTLNSLLIEEHSKSLRNLLFYGDIVSMNNSIENRSPFLDHRLVDFVFQHDSDLKIFAGQNKYALKNLPRYSKYKELLDRKKVGFEGEFKAEIKEHLRSILLVSDILNWSIFTPKLKIFLSSKKCLSSKYERFLFRLFQVHLWAEEYKK